MKVELLYVADCPNWQIADARLTEALGLVGLAGQQVQRRLIATDEEAQAAQFRGSPTLLLDGTDPFTADGSSGFGLTCRMYPAESGPAGAPTVDQLVAILRAYGAG